MLALASFAGSSKSFTATTASTTNPTNITPAQNDLAAFYKYIYIAS